MDLLPQEIIEAIIDNISHSSLHPSSLVARRWRTRSQQRVLHSITFSSEDKVDRWHSDIQRGQNPVLSYVQFVSFNRIDSWNEPALFGCVLKGFCSLKTLETFGCAIPDELAGQISRGEFGGGITALAIRCPRCDLSTITSMILSLPDLKTVSVTLDKGFPRQPLSTSIAPQRRSLEFLRLSLYANEVAEVLIRSRFTFRTIWLGGSISGTHRLLAVSSETLVTLVLDGL